MHDSSDPGVHAIVRFPDPPAHVHLMGICGTGMGSLAGMFHESGYRVTGSDQGAYPPMSEFLRRLKIPVMEGYGPSNLDPSPDLVVVGNVIRRDNPEALKLRQSGIPYCTMPQALNGLFSRTGKQIVVTGTHGKTSVSAMIAWILHSEGLDPGFMIGGLPGNFMKNYRLGRGPYFVVEGDEYDTAYFEKTPKFMHYRPYIGVITSCEFDHGDIYDSLDQITDRFRAFSGLIPQDGCLVVYAGDERVLAVAEGSDVPVEDYGVGEGSIWRIADFREEDGGLRTRLCRGAHEVASGTLPLLGYHNLLNAVAAIAVGARVGIDPQKAMDDLKSFEGVKRRQEVLGEEAGVLVIDDFAHHPTAVKATCEGVRSRYPNRRFVAVFEPRTNTSRTSIFQTDYVAAFGAPDLTVLREPRDVEKIPTNDRFSSAQLAQDLCRQGKRAQAFVDTDEILGFLSTELKEGDVVVVMSNGSFDGLNTRLLGELREARL
jgi:UDP-N-acetylmuramate: L-alanyl-gamma-D-glutamyl-meso-diaminopimelate ligase